MNNLGGIILLDYTFPSQVFSFVFLILTIVVAVQFLRFLFKSIKALDIFIQKNKANTDNNKDDN